MQVTLKIYRSNPLSNEDPGFETFNLDLEPEETVSGALQHIYETIDSTLAFRFSCNMQKCGECAVMVNDRPCLACDTTIEPEMTISPLPNLPVIKDLVVDRNAAIRSIFRIGEFYHGPNFTNRPVSTPGPLADTSIALGKCIGCLMCQSVCPAREKHPNQFVGPLGILWLKQKGSDNAEEKGHWKREMEKALQFCDLCGKCWKICPDHLDLLALVLKPLKNMKKKSKSQDNGGIG